VVPKYVGRLCRLFRRARHSSVEAPSVLRVLAVPGNLVASGVLTSVPPAFRQFSLARESSAILSASRLPVKLQDARFLEVSVQEFQGVSRQRDSGWGVSGRNYPYKLGTLLMMWGVISSLNLLS
jgi:hypothetical protein